MTFADIKRGVAILRRVLWTCGVKADYRRVFWKFAWPRLKMLDIERVISVGVVVHHLISFAREVRMGRQNASFYSEKLRDQAEATARLPATSRVGRRELA